MTAAMLRSVLRRSAAASYASSRGFNSASTQERKVAILGAAGGIGQPLSLLMKLNPMVSSLALYDIAGTPGVAADVSHINTRSEERKVAILGAAGGIGQPLSLLMKLNPMVSSLALYDIAGTPGVAADVSHINTRSEATPQANLSADVIEVLTKRTQDGGTEVVEAKAGKGSTTLSMAYAGVTFADACLKGLNGVPNVVECSFVQSTIKSTITELPFFASKVRLGKNGIKGVLGLGPMTDFEVYPTAPSVYEPIQPTFRPLSPHLPIYKPQTSSTVSITNRISAIILTTVPLSYAFLTLKVGPICLANESVYQALHYASKLGPISLQITALAAVYHLVHGIHDVYLLFK